MESCQTIKRLRDKKKIGLEHDVQRTVKFFRDSGKFLESRPIVVQPGTLGAFEYGSSYSGSLS